MISKITNFFGRSISRLVMASFAFVLLFPLGFLVSSLPDQSWGSVKKEILDKHQLIAKSTGETIRLYFSSYQKSLHVFASSINLAHKKDPGEIQARLDDLLKILENVSVISYLSLDDYSKVVSIGPNSQDVTRDSEPLFLKYLAFGNRHSSIRAVSPVFKGSVSKEPVVLVKTYVHDGNGVKRGILFAEVGLNYLNEVCGEIGYGLKEYCTVVDSMGKVIAHPNEKWVAQSFDLSSLPIVQNIKKGRSGTQNFYSSYLDQDAISGYVTIKELGWGIMISQSMDDLNSPLRKVLYIIIKWLVLGVLLALIVAFFLTKEITKPLNLLVLKSKEAGVRGGSFNLGDVPKNSPLEIEQVWIALSSLIARLQRSNDEIKKFNYSLRKDVQKATEKLRKTNKYLFKISSRDHLTNIANRRFFEQYVNKILNNQKNIGEKVSIILIDVDKFKFINDTYGHDAGDLALVHIAKLMQSCIREEDLPARLGGDEFVIYIKNCGPRSLQRVAEKLRKAVENNPIVWQGKEIKLTLSVGIVNYNIDGRVSLTQLLKFADEAMYVSKKKGRNLVVSYSDVINAKKVSPQVSPKNQNSQAKINQEKEKDFI